MVRSTLKWGDNSILDEVILITFGSTLVILSLLGAAHAILHKRDPRSALVWLLINIGVPLFGPLAYWLLGINRISRKAHRLHRGLHTHGRALQTPHDTAYLLPERFRSFRKLEHLADNIIRTRALNGNTILPLFNGEQAYPEMLKAINQAQHSIHMSSYIFDGDGAGEAFAKALASAASRGVSVRIIVDALGELYSKLPIRKALLGTAVEVHPYLPLHKSPFINLRNHRKLLIVDNNLAFSGGMNIRSNHCITQVTADKGTRDIHFQISGPAIHELQQSFIDDWHFVTGEKIAATLLPQGTVAAGEAVVRVISDGPDRNHRKLESLITGALSVAQKSVWIMTPYFVPDRAMISALKTTALRGVDVTIILPQHSNLPFVSWASRASYWELLQNGVTIFEQPPPFNHTKLMTIDGLWSLIGSANLDTRSLRLNFELNMAIYDTYLAESLNQYVEDVLNFSHRTSLREMDSRNLAVRLRDGFARLFSPYL